MDESRDAQQRKFIKAAHALGVDVDEHKLSDALRRMGRAPDDGPTQAPEAEPPEGDPAEPTPIAYCS